MQFAQPNSSAITLNRVTGATASAIDGAIQANGQVWLINPNGILFGQGAQIHIAGLLATTSDIADADFLAGDYNFTTGNTSNAVVNNGSIHAAKGGSVILSGSSVSNTGLIKAKAGHVVLGGADAFTVDFAGDNLLSYAVTAPVAHETTDANGNPQSATVSNSGIIRAPGGTILMTARAAANVADGVVNNSGVAEASSAHMENGEVVLDAGDGTATDSGTLNASGKGAGETGGTVEVLGQTVAVTDGAKIDVSGDAGGGTALIGGNFHGAGPQANAQTTSVGKATIKANAIHSGKGGNVAVWSNGQTSFAGSITAKGGASSGNGGQVETSGATLSVSADATVNTFAANGVSGNWLLDPHDITIAISGRDAVSGESYSTTPATDVTINPTAIANALASGSVTLQANTDITVASNISVSGGTGNTLSLTAGRSIMLTNSASINFSGGNVFLSANDANAIAANRDAGAATISSGTTGGVTAANVALILNSNGQDGSSIGSSTTPFLVNGGAPTYIQTSGANAYVTVGDGVSTSFTLGNPVGNYSVNMTGGNLFIKAAGVTQVSPILVNNLTVTLPASISSGNPITLTDLNNGISGTVSLAAMGGSATDSFSFIKLVNSQPLTIGTISDVPNTGSATYGSLELTANNGGLTLTGNIDAGLMTLNSQGNFIQTGGILHSHATDGLAGALAINVTNDGSLSLPDANILDQIVTGTNFGTVVSAVGQLVFAASGSATVNFASSLQLQGAYASSGDVSITSTGSYTLTDQNSNTVTHYNEIDINNPIAVTGMVTLHAAGDVKQLVGPSGSVQIIAPGGLIATSDMGQLVLSDGGHAADSTNGYPADPGNQVGGAVLLNAATNAAFTNTVTTTIGIPGSDNPQTSVIGGNLDVEVTDANQNVAQNGHSLLVMNGRVHTQQTVVSGDTVLHATGDLDNANGNGTITATNLSLVSDYGTVGAPYAGSYWTFGDGRDSSGPLNLHASAINGGVVINPGDLNIGTDLAGPGLQAQSVLIFGNGVITQNADSTGTIVTSNLDAHAANNITLTNPNNAVGLVSFTTPGNATFYNSIQTTINRANNDHDSNGNELAMGNLDLEVADPSGGTNPGIYVLGNSLTDSIDSSGQVVLHAAGAITSSTNPIIGNTVRLISATGAIGTPTAPMLVIASTLAATTVNQNIVITASTPTANLTIGDGTYGISAGTGNVTLMAGSAPIVETAGNVITANNLNISGASIILGDVEVSTLNATTNGGAISISSNGAFMLDNLTGVVGAAAINSNGGSVHLTATGGISQATGTAGAIVAANLDADPAAPSANLTLDNPGNQVTGIVTLRGPNNVTFVNSINTFLGTSSAGGIFTATSSGNLTIVSGATLTAGAGGDALKLSASNNFINNAGAGAVSLTGGGRFLIYSANPANDVFNNLNSNNTAVWNTTYPTNVTASGNRYVFAISPVLTEVAGNITKTYGTDVSAQLPGDLTISGLQPGVANAFLGDTAASVYSGATAISTNGAGASTGVGSYAITVGGNLTTMDGYQLATKNGILTVNPATLTYTANSANRTAGTANPAFSGTVSGFVNGETQASATSGTAAFNTAATTSSPAGSYGILGSGLSAANYVFVQAAANSTALTITLAPVTMTTPPAATTTPPATTTTTAPPATAPTTTTTTTTTTPPPAVTTTTTTTTTTPPATTGTTTITITTPPATISSSNTVTVITTGSGTSSDQVAAVSPAFTAFITSNQAIAQPAFTLISLATPNNGTIGLSVADSLLVAGMPVGALVPPVVNPIEDLVLASSNDQGSGTEQPLSSDLQTNYVVASLDGGASATKGGSRGASNIVIPGLLRAAPGATQASAPIGNDLSAWGNSALWQ